MKTKICIKQSEAGERVDLFLTGKLTDSSRNRIAQSIKNGEILVNNQSIKPNYKLKTNDIIEISIAKIEKIKKPRGESIPLDIIFENQDILVINKQPGIVVHPAAGHEDGTLVNAIINHFPDIVSVVYDKNNLISTLRPGLVHRLDKDTSGIIMIAKNKRTLHSLSKQIQNRTIKKTYVGICAGWPKNENGRLINYLGRHPKNRKLVAEVGKERGKEAILDYSVINYYTDEKGDKLSLLEFNLLTGRTHQIRVQTNLIGHPIVGDSVYHTKQSQLIGKRHEIRRQLLHAMSVSITLPGDTKPTTFLAKIPTDISSLIEKLIIHNFS